MKLLFRWYDFYVGAYYDRDRGYLYLVFFMFGVRLSIKRTDYRRKQAERNLKYMGLMGDLTFLEENIRNFYASASSRKRHASRLHEIIKRLEDYRWTPVDLIDTSDSEVIAIAARLVGENEYPYNQDSPLGEWCIICKADKPAHESDCAWILLESALEFRKVE